MITININQFKGYTIKDIHEFLSLQNSNHYEIFIPKMEADPGELNFSIFWDYHVAAYAGQKLNSSSESFAYDVPCPKRQNPFRFELETNDLMKLSIALRFIIVGYYTNGSGMTNFHQHAAAHFDEAYKGKTDPACWGLLYIANEYLGK